MRKPTQMSSYDRSSAETFWTPIGGFIPVAQWRRAQSVRSIFLDWADKEVARCGVSHNCRCPNLPVCGDCTLRNVTLAFVLSHDTHPIWYKCGWTSSQSSCTWEFIKTHRVSRGTPKGSTVDISDCWVYKIYRKNWRATVLYHAVSRI